MKRQIISLVITAVVAACTVGVTVSQLRASAKPSLICHRNCSSPADCVNTVCPYCPDGICMATPGPR